MRIRTGAGGGEGADGCGLDSGFNALRACERKVRVVGGTTGILRLGRVLGTIAGVWGAAGVTGTAGGTGKTGAGESCGAEDSIGDRRGD